MTLHSSDRVNLLTGLLKQQCGAVLVTFAASALALMLFFGLAVDVGYMYMARAAISKGTDAAALMGVRNLGQGETVATQIAQSTFAMNYAGSGLSTRQTADPLVAVSYSLDENGNKRITVNVQVRISTFVLGVIPDLATVQVHSVAQAARAKLIMGIALDRSGSMVGNGGAAALPSAVAAFVNYFDDVNDRVSMSSYSDYVILHVPMGNNFKAIVTSKAKSLNFNGYTYTHGGIDSARQQINSIPVVAGDNMLRALVFFTDGQANSFLSNIECKKSKPFQSLVLIPGSNTDDFRSPNTGITTTCDSSSTKTFSSVEYSGIRTRNDVNVTEEGIYLAEHSALLARQDGTLVFAIGLGNDIDKETMRRMANDPASTTFDPTQPVGLAAFAPTSAGLEDVFRQIAAKILLRLTQ